jgi:hypothetical protein
MSEEPERTLEELAAAILSGAVRLAAATAAWLRLVGEFDARGGWQWVGVKSCAHWLSWQCGLGPGAAREHVRVARALRDLPLIEAAFADGRLTYSKVRAITRVAEPVSQEMLIEFAIESTASQLERVVRQWRRADGEDEAELAYRRRFSYSYDEAGMLVLRARMTPEEGAPLIAAIESLAERAARRERAAAKRARGKHAAAEARGEQVDRAMVERCDENAEWHYGKERTAERRCVALASLAQGAVDRDRRAGDPPRREVVVHVDADVIADDAAAGRAYIEGGPSLTPVQARRMLCESTVVVMLEKDREVLAVGRTKRRATKAQRRALLRRDGGCIRPGCPENRIERLHAHHMRHWLYGGRTDLDNMVLLCDVDHGLVHDEDYVMSRRGGRLIVTTPDGRRIWGSADAVFTEGLAGLESLESQPEVAAEEPRFAGVAPLDQSIGRRPDTTPCPRRAAAPAPGHPDRAASRPGGTDRPGNRRPGRATRRRASRRGARGLYGPMAQRPPAAPIGATLFPAGEPPLPDAPRVNGERMDLRYVVSVLLGNRNVLRRAAAEAGVALLE